MEHLISDLALILIVAGTVSLLFKKLKQPLVLGYIVAGILTSPHMPYTPSVADMSTLQVWADIGVVFLMFTLGLEFSFKKIIKMGAGPMIAAVLIIFCMMSIGSVIGHLFGWGRITSLFLGGILAMSSTTIIYKALDDLGLRQQKFAGTVLSVLVLEDILGVLLMVILSAVAVTRGVQGSQLINSMLRLSFVLILWFIVGVFLIPLFLRKMRKWMNRETLLVVSLGLCFAMVVIAEKMGYSAAFGAFMMGSILAETVEAEQITNVVSPVKDLFGAIFFVSVGMLVNPIVLAQYWLPIVVLTLAIIVGQAIFGTCGFLFSGQPLKQAMQCSFSMTQIGEFSFIIASLGVSLGVTDSFLYPVVVAVSIVTTFITPYMIRAAEPTYRGVERMLPGELRNALKKDRVKKKQDTPAEGREWKRLLAALFKQVGAYAVLCIAVIGISLGFLLPLSRGLLGHWPGNIVCGVLTLLISSPFLRAIVMRKNHSEEFKTLWKRSKLNRPLLQFIILMRYAFAVAMVYYVLNFLSPYANWIHVLVAMTIVELFILIPFVKTVSIKLEHIFQTNLRSREIKAQKEGRMAPRYAGRLAVHNVHIAQLELPENSLWAGKTLKELKLGHDTGVLIASIVRDGIRHNIPDGDSHLFPGDRLEAIGDDDSLRAAAKRMETETDTSCFLASPQPMTLKRIVVPASSSLAGCTVAESRLRELYRCMAVGIEADNDMIEASTAQTVIRPGCALWVVGEGTALEQLCKSLVGKEK